MKEMIEFGSPVSSNVLIQLVDGHDLLFLENEVKTVQELTGENICLWALKVDSWNQDLSPWKAPAVFGDEPFGDGAEKTLSRVLNLISDREKTYYIGGYSLAGLFSLWAAYQTEVFAGVAAASPSVWFPGFLDYMKEHKIKTRKVYLSLGDRESGTKNSVMAAVGDRIQKGYELLKDRSVNCILEWNQGNHFKEPDIRTAKAFS